MPWPPALPPANRSDATPQITSHADDHNLTAAALDELVKRVNGIQSAYSGTLTTNSAGAVTVSFPVPFVGANPRVICTPVFNDVTQGEAVMHLLTVTTTQFQAVCYRGGTRLNSSAFAFMWLAIGAIA